VGAKRRTGSLWRKHEGFNAKTSRELNSQDRPRRTSGSATGAKVLFRQAHRHSHRTPIPPGNAIATAHRGNSPKTRAGILDWYMVRRHLSLYDAINLSSLFLLGSNRGKRPRVSVCSASIFQIVRREGSYGSGTYTGLFTSNGRMVDPNATTHLARCPSSSPASSEDSATGSKSSSGDQAPALPRTRWRCYFHHRNGDAAHYVYH